MGFREGHPTWRIARVTAAMLSPDVSRVTSVQDSPKRMLCIVSMACCFSLLPVTTTHVRQLPPSADERSIVRREFWNDNQNKSGAIRMDREKHLHDQSGWNRFDTNYNPTHQSFSSESVIKRVAWQVT